MRIIFESEAGGSISVDYSALVPDVGDRVKLPHFDGHVTERHWDYTQEDDEVTVVVAKAPARR